MNEEIPSTAPVDPTSRELLDWAEKEKRRLRRISIEFGLKDSGHNEGQQDEDES
jgi:hypothetical protein